METLEIQNDYEFQDVVICALRYALYRHTYTCEEIIDFIIANPKIQNDRVKTVMLRDIEEVLKKDAEDIFPIHDCDKKTILKLKEWLEKEDFKK